MCDDSECREECACWETGYETAEKKMQSTVDDLEDKIEALKQKLDDIVDGAAY